MRKIPGILFVPVLLARPRDAGEALKMGLQGAVRNASVYTKFIQDIANIIYLHTFRRILIQMKDPQYTGNRAFAILASPLLH